MGHHSPKEVAVPGKLLTTTQAGERLGVSRTTINKWIDIGLFPNAFKLGALRQSPVRIPESDVEAIEEQRRKEQRERVPA